MLLGLVLGLLVGTAFSIGLVLGEAVRFVLGLGVLNPRG